VKHNKPTDLIGPTAPCLIPFVCREARGKTALATLIILQRVLTATIAAPLLGMPRAPHGAQPRTVDQNDSILKIQVI
jgi:hypothetical protein